MKTIDSEHGLIKRKLNFFHNNVNVPIVRFHGAKYNRGKSKTLVVMFKYEFTLSFTFVMILNGVITIKVVLFREYLFIQPIYEIHLEI